MRFLCWNNQYTLTRFHSKTHTCLISEKASQEQQEFEFYFVLELPGSVWSSFPFIWNFFCPGTWLCCWGYLSKVESSPFLVGPESMPGKLVARFWNSYLILTPAFALVSINMTPSSLANAWPSSVATALFSAISILFPTRTIRRSCPLIAFASSIHFWTF